MVKQEQKPVESKVPNQTELLREANGVARAEIQAACPQFIEWMDSLGRWGGNLIDGSVLAITERAEKQPVRFRATVFTKIHSYTISVRIDSGNGGYLGCTASTRMPRAGEDWARGNDLADGKFCQETWNRILVSPILWPTNL